MRQATTHRLVEDEELAVPVPGRYLMASCTMLSMRYDDDITSKGLGQRCQMLLPGLPKPGKFILGT